ncbi:hypothetical protein VTN96DRAFT_5449 [Rasamsonia emersonii]
MTLESGVTRMLRLIPGGTGTGRCEWSTTSSQRSRTGCSTAAAWQHFAFRYNPQGQYRPGGTVLLPPCLTFHIHCSWRSGNHCSPLCCRRGCRSRYNPASRTEDRDRRIDE